MIHDKAYDLEAIQKAYEEQKSGWHYVQIGFTGQYKWVKA